MKLEYDPEADGLSVYFSRKRRSYRTTDLSCEPSFRLVDYGRDGTPIGVEILGTKQGIDVRGLPRAEEVAACLVAHGFRVLSREEVGRAP
ncbi:MAG: DUF2283 domain-containing protein [Chloroflexi bacterium]|nr:DUF2283 domain-containing protein [Chloroflexota bacterium]